MLGKLLLVVTALLPLCSCNLYDDDNTYGYYYKSQFRPGIGWHRHGGAYRVVSHFNDTGHGSCKLSTLEGWHGHNFTKPAISITAPRSGMLWSKGNGFCIAYCNFTINKVFITHCGGIGQSFNTCPLTGGLTLGNILITAILRDGSTVNKTVTTRSYSKFLSLHCVGRNTEVYLNGDLVFTSNESSDVADAGVHFKAGGPLTYKVMEEYQVLAKFENGTAQDIILCDNTPKGLLACQYNNGDFTDGLYPFVNETKPKDRFIVYKMSNATTVFPLKEVTFMNVSSAGPNLGGVDSIIKYQTHVSGEGYYKFNFSFLTGFKREESNFNYGSYYGKPDARCDFVPETINNGLWFNSLTISIGYGPIDGGCKQSVWTGKATCCFAYSHSSLSSKCKGVYNGQLKQDLKCGLLIFITKSPGSRLQTREDPFVVTENFYNNITLDVCVDYNIYGVTGRGYITNITASVVSEQYLQSGGLAVLDTAGSIDVFMVEGENGPNYYKINPCEDVNQQFVVSGGKIVGVLTSINETNSQQVEDLFFVKIANGTRRKSRSISDNKVTICPYTSYGKFCFKPNGELAEIVPEEIATYSSPLLNVSENVLIPETFNLTVTDEYIQTSMEKVQINCIQYVCGNSIECKKLFQQYGPVCDNILNIVNSLAQQDNMELLQFYSATKPKGFDTPILNNVSADGFNLSLVLKPPSNPKGRSFIEDLLFTKVESLGLPGDTAYQKCTSGPLGFVKDLVCAQHYNGLLVLPPIITAEMQTMYTASLVASMAFGGITSAGAIPFATQIQARINHLGITQTVLQKNQEQIAASFNKAMNHMQDGFRATSSALQQIQDVVNKQSAVLQDAMNALNKNFGAISSVIQDIYSRLDTIEANAQVDRLISGRLSSLSVLASAKQAEYARVSQQRELAKQKINECVKSQSERYGFCGAGRHVLTIPQNAPKGIVLLHFTYTPETYKNVTAVVGFCVTPENGTQYAIVPVSGRGIFIQENDTYYITARDMYMPRAITAGDVVTLTSCQANYEQVNRTVITTFVDNDDFNFEDELSKWWNGTKHELPDLDQFNYTIPVLNITYDIDKIEEVIKGLNDSLIDLETLSILKTYIKWPWYIWLAIAFLTIIFILVLVWIFFMTGCCGCCCGCFGIIPLVSKCGKKSSYYSTFDEDIVGVQIKPKKNV